MGIEFASTVDTPRADVWSWFEQPGALRRLMPPWQHMSVVRESTSLRDGTAELGLPGGLRWVSRHDPDAFVEESRFVDHIAADGLLSLPAASTVRWRHHHEFEDTRAGGTRIVDRVETVVPGPLLRPMFVWRHRQIAQDLDRHRVAAALGIRPVTVAITGSSGLVGTALSAFLSTGGYRVIRLVRGNPTGPDERRWNPAAPASDLLQGVDALVHLAGASIAGRFTDQHRTAVRDSRIEPTRRLAELAATVPGGPRTIVTASAIGLYGNDLGDRIVDESSPVGDGFLAGVVRDWERATMPAVRAGLRVVTVRTGLAMSAAGGLLRLLRPLYSAGLGGAVGDGRQWMSWIDLDDLLDVYLHALVDPEVAGPVNAVAPNPVRGEEFTRTLAHVLHRPAILPVPSIAPRALLGEEGARELAFASQRVRPGVLDRLGHTYRRPRLEDSLRHQLGRIEV